MGLNRKKKQPNQTNKISVTVAFERHFTETFIEYICI